MPGFRCMLLMAAVAAASACSDPLPVDVPASLTGEWNWSWFVLAGAEDQCHSSGTMQLTQTGATVDGAAQTYSAGCALVGSGLTASSITDSTLTLHIGTCTLVATLHAALPDSVAGTATCTVPAPFSGYVGTWSAARVGAPSTIQLLPGDLEVVVGAKQTYQATVRDAAGHVLFGPAISFASSAPSTVAIVATPGIPGSIEVSALAEGGAVLLVTGAGLQANAIITVWRPSFTRVEAGGDFTCALTAAGAVWCWGRPVPATPNTATWPTSPVRLNTTAAFTSISAGGGHVCGLTAAGVAFCWGGNRAGQLGTGDTIPDALPRAVLGVIAFAQIAAGTASTCGLTSAGAAYCWGANGSGELGNGTHTTALTPSPVSGGRVFTSIASWSDHACGTTATTAYCWGIDTWGEAGNGAIDSAGLTVPTPITGGLSFGAVSPGGIHACGLAGGIGYCWGNGVYGTLGDGTKPVYRLAPSPIAGGRSYTAIGSSFNFSCALTAPGAAWCWGTNTLGQLGDSTQTERSVPVAAAGGLAFTQISVGSNHACGIAAGAVWCWGYNLSGQIGDGTMVTRLTPVKVLGQP